MIEDKLIGILLFKDMSGEEIESSLIALEAEEKNYRKGTVIFHTGSKTSRMGIVLSGSVTIENTDFWGNRTILSHIGEGNFFAETYAMLSDEAMLVDAVANENCSILFLKIGKLNSISSHEGLRMHNHNSDIASGSDSDSKKKLKPGKSIEWQDKIMRNLLTISMNKNLALSSRSFHISPKGVRGRVMAFLNTFSIRTGKDSFVIPFDRQQMADYLNLDRTALSKELGKMREEGLIEFRKNHFTILKPDELI